MTRRYNQVPKTVPSFREIFQAESLESCGGCTPKVRRHSGVEDTYGLQVPCVDTVWDDSPIDRGRCPLSTGVRWSDSRGGTSGDQEEKLEKERKTSNKEKKGGLPETGETKGRNTVGEGKDSRTETRQPRCDASKSTGNGRSIKRRLCLIIIFWVLFFYKWSRLYRT